jgi:hypothetical protein
MQPSRLSQVEEQFSDIAKVYYPGVTPEEMKYDLQKFDIVEVSIN